MSHSEHALDDFTPDQTLSGELMLGLIATETASRSRRQIGNTSAVGGAVQGAYLHSIRKRWLDISGALLLLAFFSPLMIVTAALVAISSRGPVLFRQQRHGANRKTFVIFKFRTMFYQESRGASVPQAQRGDPRVTRLGRLLRMTSIDELPQLFNVLAGDMSLVGPRPHAITHDDAFQSVIDDYSRRFAAKPGITGLAQVSGARGATPTIADVQRRIDWDLCYLESASLRKDISIVLLTAREIIWSRHAF